MSTALLPDTHQPVAWAPGRAATPADLAASEHPQPGGPDYGADLRCRLFERSAANLRLFDLEPIVSFAEALVSPDCHVVHNNGFRTRPGTRLAPWHQDDAPHFLVTHGERPTNIR